MKRRALTGWLLVAAGTIIIVIINGTFYGYGVFFKPLLQEFGWARAELSGPISLRLMATGIFGIMAGMMVDRAGPRWVVSAGVFLVAIGFFLTSTVTNLWQMYLYLGLISGIGMSVPFPAVTTLASRWFTKRRGLAMGVVMGGYGIGQMVFPPLITHWIESSSWRTAFVIVALTVGLVAIPLALCLKFPRDANPSPKKPEAAKAAGTKVSPLQPENHWTLKECVRSLPLWKICLIYFLFSISLQAMMVHLVPHAIDSGIEPLAAAILLTIIGGTNTFGRVTGGGFMDRLGTRRVLIFCLIAPALMMPALIFARGLLPLYVIAAVYGIGYGGISTAIPKLTSEYYGLGSLGGLLGVVQLAFAAGGAVGGPLAGYIFDKTNSYTFAFALLFVLIAVAFVVCLTLRPPVRTRKLGG